MRISDWSSDVCSSDLPSTSTVIRLPSIRPDPQTAPGSAASARVAVRLATSSKKRMGMAKKRFMASILQENGFDRQAEQIGAATDEGERGVVVARPGRFDPLARHTQPFAQVDQATVPP